MPDWAGHHNDAGRMLHEMIKFDESIKTVYEWAKGRDDTIIILTADHETGSFGFSDSGIDLPAPIKLPGSAFAGRDYAPNENFGPFSTLDRIYAQKMSFVDMMAAFYELPEDQQKPTALAKIINGASEFKITEAGAANVLADAPNLMRIEGHPDLDRETLPKVDDFTEFYLYGDEIRFDLIGRELAAKQNVVWGTGTHTNTPVAVIVWGRPEGTKQLPGMMHQKEIGVFMIGVLSD